MTNAEIELFTPFSQDVQTLSASKAVRCSRKDHMASRCSSHVAIFPRPRLNLYRVSRHYQACSTHLTHTWRRPRYSMATLSDLLVELMLRVMSRVSEAMHEDADTEKFLESPIVAPREVDKAFWRLILARYQDLDHLALTSRAMRPLAQECLFRTVAVDNSARTENGAITGIHRLLVTLSRRSDSAKRAQSLHIDIDPFVVHHLEHPSKFVTGCEKSPCHCRFHELQDVCATLVDGIEMSFMAHESRSVVVLVLEDAV